MGGLESKNFLTIGARVMLSRNLWTEFGLCNGVMGYVYDITYKTRTVPPCLPVAVMVQFDENYIGPSFIANEPRCIPVPPVLSTSGTLGSSHERQHFEVSMVNKYSQVPGAYSKKRSYTLRGLIFAWIKFRDFANFLSFREN